MASSLFVDMAELRKLYVDQLKSIPEISADMNISQSTVRARLKDAMILRSREDGIRNAAKQGKLGGGMRGTTRTFSQQWKNNMAMSARRRGENTAKGTSRKPSGYIAHTRGANKDRSVHVVAVEESIGRRLYWNEVVHHIDHNRSNNQSSNLKLMTRSEHARLHAIENAPKRKRDANGKFE